MADKEEKKTKASKIKMEREQEEKVEVEESPKDNKETTEELNSDEKIVEKQEVEVSTDEASEGDNTSEEDVEEKSDRFAHATVYADDASAITIEKRFSFMRVILFVSIILVSAAVFFGAMLYYQKNSGNFNFSFDSNFVSFLPFMKPTPTPTNPPTPTPTKEPEITLSDYQVQVLNGSGVSGAAGTVANLLEDEGFEDVAAGNANEQDYEDTEVQVKRDVPAKVFDTLGKILSEYTLVEGDALEDDDEHDIVITVGQKNEE